MSLEIYEADIYHARHLPKAHHFRYKSLYVSKTLTRLDATRFSWRKWGVFSIKAKDYLGWNQPDLISACEEFLRSKQPHQKVDQVRLYTSPRLFGYVFNPISFFCCYFENQFCGMIVDVNNTFSEKHVYILSESLQNQEQVEVKDFHVSPFFKTEGSYVFSFKEDSKKNFNLQIRYLLAEKEVFRASMRGTRQVDSFTCLLKTGLTPWLTYPRILFQAGILYFRKALKVETKPSPSSMMTLRSEPNSILERWSMKILLSSLSKMKEACLELELPDHRLLSFGKSQMPKRAYLKVKDYRFFSHVLRYGDIGLGEAYEKNWWDSEDVVGVLNFFVMNLPRIPKPSIIGSAVQRWHHFQNRNTRSGSKRNIASHYDLSNEFFSLWLDPEMMYSSAIYEDTTSTLDAAQKVKIQKIIQALDLKPGMKVLEIGTGWGALCCAMGKMEGLQIDSVTISKEQYAYTIERLKKEKLQSKVNVELKDYRDLRGKYDRIVSIEMLEAVGHENLPTYFEKCSELLTDKGLIFIQVISMPDARYDSYRKSVDWIRRYIFPGGHLPSLGAMTRAMASNTNLFMDSVLNISTSYSRTLADWKTRFGRVSPELDRLGFDQSFQRRWNYYFDYCRSGFDSEMVQNYQIILKKSGVFHEG